MLCCVTKMVYLLACPMYNCSVNTFSASLFISIASVSTYVTDLSPSRSVSLSVCPESVLQQNGWMDPGAVWDDEWRRQSRDGCIRRRSTCPKGRRGFGGFVPPLPWGQGAEHVQLCMCWFFHQRRRRTTHLFNYFLTHSVTRIYTHIALFTFA